MIIYWDDTPLPNELRALLEKALQTAADMEGIVGDHELSISFVTATEMRVMNRNYRGSDKETDVLSFPGFAGSFGLGDIIICLNIAERQAKLYNHSFEREMTFLAVHGFLHLLGYDHHMEEDEREMNEAQNKILEAIGVSR